MGKKKKQKQMQKQKQEQQLIPGIPDEVGLQILARAPRSCHPFMKLVSKAWNSTMSSDPIYALRRHLGVTEQWLYFLFIQNSECNCFSLDPRGAWCRLPPIPTVLNTLTYRFCNFSMAEFQGCLYIILEDIEVARVARYCPRSSCWTTLPLLTIPRFLCRNGLFNSFVYVLSDTDDTPASEWSRFANMTISGVSAKTGTSPGGLWVTKGALYRSLSDRSVYVPDCGEVYEPVTDKWSPMPRGMLRQVGVLNTVMEDGLEVGFMGTGWKVKYDFEHECWWAVATVIEVCEAKKALDAFWCRVSGCNREIYVVKTFPTSTVVVMKADLVSGEETEVARKSFSRTIMMRCQDLTI